MENPHPPAPGGLPLPPDLAAGLAPHHREALNHQVRRAILRRLSHGAEPHTLAELGRDLPDLEPGVVRSHLLLLEEHGCISVSSTAPADRGPTWRYSSNVADNRQVGEVLVATERSDGVIG